MTQPTHTHTLSFDFFSLPTLPSAPRRAVAGFKRSEVSGGAGLSYAAIADASQRASDKHDLKLLPLTNRAWRSLQA